jgi:hypothetical protein
MPIRRVLLLAANFSAMYTWRVRQLGAAAVVIAVLLAVVAVAAAPAQAQEDLHETCAFYGLITGTGGQTAATAAADLQALSAPNPFGVNNVLEVIINAESDVPPIGSRPTASAREVAYQELDNYYGAVCADIDICPLIRQAVATNDGSSAEAARLARWITATAPPGIDAALALIAGEITESPFHVSITEAQDQVDSYFPCAATAGAIDTPAPAPTSIADPAPGVLGDGAATCGDLAVLSIAEGPLAVEAAQNLRQRGAANPPAIEAALDVMIAAADFGTGSPPLAEIDAALATLDGYFGGVCANIDRCAFVNQIAGTDAAVSAEVAGLMRRIETPSPPGIDAALALIAGDIDDSPFHDTVAQAREQVLSYYPCGGNNNATGGGLAFTGSLATAPLALLGTALVTSGAAMLHARRRLLSDQL